MNKLLEALKGIEKCCDGNNPEHEQIWHIANDAIKEAEAKQLTLTDVVVTSYCDSKVCDDSKGILCNGWCVGVYDNEPKQ